MNQTNKPATTQPTQQRNPQQWSVLASIEPGGGGVVSSAINLPQSVAEYSIVGSLVFEIRNDRASLAFHFDPKSKLTLERVSTAIFNRFYRARASPSNTIRTPTMSQQNNANANEMLTTALKETLQRTGTLDNVRAQLRATILQNLSDSLPSATTAAASNATPPTPPIENILINELISEYLSFNGYNQTLSAFAAETGCLKVLRYRSGGIIITMLVV